MSVTSNYICHVTLPYDFNIFIGITPLYSHLVTISVLSLLFLTSLQYLRVETTTLINPLSLIEEELGAIEDYVVLGVLVLLGILFFISGALIITPLTSTSAALTSVLTIFTTGVLVPSSVLQRFGVEAPQFVRGVGKTSNFLYEFVLDFVSTLTIFVRFIVQNIRIVFLIAAYWELYAFVDSMYLEYPTFELINISATSAGLAKIFAHTILYLYYVGHLCILYTVQVTAYLSLSFWLFFFLYTNVSSSKHENYF